MKVVTARIPDEYLKELKIIEREEQAERAEVIRRLLADSIKRWKIKRALNLLNERKVTLRKAASIAGVSYVEMLDLASAHKIDIGYSLEELERDTRNW